MKILVKMNLKKKGQCYLIVIKIYHYKIKNKYKILIVRGMIIILNLMWNLMKFSIILMKILMGNKAILKISNCSLVNKIDCKA